ncbi:YceI family protein [Kitasatospora sp. NPDC059327]|uniref:YceI family protein n=1 Tax=Kitasatospora sp. NPDC059327 TaxID=3346803 RepID=UPI0036A9EE0B
MSANTEPVSGFSTGTWAIDPTHSEIGFSVRHLGVAKVRGRFESFEGRIVTAENPLESSVSVTVQAVSFSTGNEQRDAHVKGEDFLDVANHPELTFASTQVLAKGDGYLVEGRLTLRGATQDVVLELEPNGFGEGYQGAQLAGFSAVTEISRKEFGVHGGAAGAMVGDKVTISLEVEAVKEA